MKTVAVEEVIYFLGGWGTSNNYDHLELLLFLIEF